MISPYKSSVRPRRAHFFKLIFKKRFPAGRRVIQKNHVSFEMSTTPASHSTEKTALARLIREISEHVINEAEREPMTSREHFEDLVDELFEALEKHELPIDSCTRLVVVFQVIKHSFHQRGFASREVFDETVELLFDVLDKRVFEKSEKGELEGPMDPDIVLISCWDSSSDWEHAEKMTTRLGYDTEDEEAYFQVCTPGGMPLEIKQWLYGSAGV